MHDGLPLNFEPDPNLYPRRILVFLVSCHHFDCTPVRVFLVRRAPSHVDDEAYNSVYLAVDRLLEDRGDALCEGVEILGKFNERDSSLYEENTVLDFEEAYSERSVRVIEQQRDAEPCV